MTLSGRLALVTGASSGIGSACARALAASGCRVAVTGRNEAALKSVASDILSKFEGSHVEVFVGDVTNDEDVKKVVSNSVSKLSENGKLDILVNCAGILEGGALGSVGIENFDANMATNARGVFSFMTAAAPFMEREKGEPTASIVNVSSVNGLQSFGGCAAYCASKAACDMLTSCAAVDFAPKNIRVNSVNPGVTRTELHKRGGMNEDQYKAFLERSVAVTHPLGRVAEPEEIAEAILFLADSSKSNFITGAHLAVDGGRICLGAR